MQICRGFSDNQWRSLRVRLTADQGALIDDQRAWECAIEVFERRMRERFFSCIETLEREDSRADVEESADAPGDGSTLPDDRGVAVLVPGFAIIALSCLLADTLQSFREAADPQPGPKGPCLFPAGSCIRPSTTDAILSFLRLPSFNGEFEDERLAKKFVSGVRNGIFHEAETRRWVIWRDEPKGRIFEPYGRGYALNRTGFVAAVKSEFERYLRQLRSEPADSERKRFLKKMDDIVKES